MTGNRTALTDFIKSKALALGFDAVGVAQAGNLDEAAPRLKAWLDQNMHGEMHYMQKHPEKRLDPRLLFEGSRSLITILLNYYPEESLHGDGKYKISKYAYGEDYHHVIKRKLWKLQEEIEKETGKIRARAFVDSAPLMDKVWAMEAGLGWIGKNTCLITRNRGSYFFIGHLLTDLELDYDKPFQKDYCGSCKLCMQACPTKAIVSPYQLDARKCISYLSIELQGAFSKEEEESLNGWVFGCDICQDVCPWNRKSTAHATEEFNPSEELAGMTKDDWEHLSEEKYRQLFKHSALHRTGYQGLIRNIRAVTNQHE
jgi:epoxyqueuosine reductase